MKYFISILLLPILLLVNSSRSFTSSNQVVFGGYPIPTYTVDYEDVATTLSNGDTFKIEITSAAIDYDIQIYERESPYVSGTGELIFEEIVYTGNSFEYELIMDSEKAYLVYIYNNINENQGEVHFIFKDCQPYECWSSSELF